MRLFRADSNSLPVRLLLDLCILLLLGWNLLQMHVLVTSTNLKDFGSFYYAVRLFLEGRDIYGPTLGTFSSSAGLHYWNLNPPHFELFVLPFGLLSPRIAVLLWLGIGLLMLVLSLRIVVEELQMSPGPVGTRFSLALLLGSAPLSSGLLTGQVALHLTLPCALLWKSLRRGRPLEAGIWAGLLVAVKPFFLILAPYLLLRRRFTVVLSAMATSLLLIVAGVLVFGSGSYASWFRSIGQISWYGLDLNGSLLGFWSRLLGGSADHTPLLHATWLVTPLWIAGSMIVGIVALNLTRQTGPGDCLREDRDLGFLLVSAFLISPLGWIHYGVLLIAPLSACFLRHCWGQAAWWFAVVGVAGFLWPGQLAPLMQTGLTRTILFGSIYFWSFLLLWLAFFLNRREEAKADRVEAGGGDSA